MGSRQYLLYAEADLMSLVEGGDEEAFAVLYVRYGRAAYSLAYRMWAKSKRPRTWPRTPSSRSGEERIATGPKGPACAPGSSP